MPTKKRWIVVAALCSAMLTQAGAQVMTYGGGAQFGLAFSTFKKPAGDLYGTGLVFGGHGDLNISRYFGVRLSFDYVTFGADNDKLKGVAADASVKAVEDYLGGHLNAQDNAFVRATVKSADGARVKAPSIFIAGLGKLPTGSMVTPYALLGFGITFMGTSDMNFVTDGVRVQNGQTGQIVQLIPAGNQSVTIDSQTKFSMQFGAGGEFAMSKLIKLFFEVKYSIIFTEGGSNSYLPLVIGVTFGG